MKNTILQRHEVEKNTFKGCSVSDVTQAGTNITFKGFSVSKDNNSRKNIYCQRFLGFRSSRIREVFNFQVFRISVDRNLIVYY